MRKKQCATWVQYCTVQFNGEMLDKMCHGLVKFNGSRNTTLQIGQHEMRKVH